jgi:hypothetical protein
LFWCQAHCGAVAETISLKQALFWMNAYVELLEVDQRALRQMQGLIAASSISPAAHSADIQLVTTEIARVADRLGYWEAIVDRANQGPLPHPN